MRFAAYRDVWRIVPARRLLLVTMVARLPHAAVALVLTLHVVETLGRSYAQAGFVAATFTVGIAVGAPWRGRRLDQVGLRRTLVPSIAVQAVVWPLAAVVDYAWLFPVALVAGVFELPVFTLVRKSLSVLVPRAQQRGAFALESILTELVFMTGPAAGVWAATQAGTGQVLVVIGAAVAVAGVVLWFVDPPTSTHQVSDGVPDGLVVGAPAVAPTAVENELRGERGEPGPGAPERAAPGALAASGSGAIDGAGGRAGRRTAWLTPAVVVVLVASAAAMFVLVGTDVGILASLRASGDVGSLGLVYFAWCSASVVGGLLYGTLHREVDPLWLLLALGALTVPMVLETSVLGLAALAALAGFACAPMLTAATEALAGLVREERRGEAMGFQGSAYTLGAAAGAPATGAAVDVVGPAGAFAAAGGLAVVVALVGLAVARTTSGRRGEARQR
ncbi:hypothetical protein GCM10025865_30270 [Paraoerskovia sediminicola]|uniref:MFS transporter n=1 Tax=Paraoerskovia sediminicola TaxID=1138587 RepID=A0ABM8G6E1_9CELL|nr:MFS transporter [Paraoerskovia sediminicola]BDZ43728.1 hypothetical protein GCM10025865_30270 [Paraoerskovia sediminicola]